MMTAAMKGELGPWAQAVAKYQMEQKVKKALEKYKLSTEKLKPKYNSSKSTEDNKVSFECICEYVVCHL